MLEQRLYLGGAAELLEELRAAGYRPVGRDFPVFLHPQTHAEHALARRERKTGPGYRGFVTEFTPVMTVMPFVVWFSSAASSCFA